MRALQSRTNVAGSALLLSRKRAPPLRALLDQANGKGIAIRLAFVGLDRRDNNEDDVRDEQSDEEKESDKYEHEEQASNAVNGDRNLEIQRLLSLLIYERKLVLLNQPDN